MMDLKCDGMYDNKDSIDDILAGKKFAFGIMESPVLNAGVETVESTVLSGGVIGNFFKVYAHFDYGVHEISQCKISDYEKILLLMKQYGLDAFVMPEGREYVWLGLADFQNIPEIAGRINTATNRGILVLYPLI